MTSFLNLQPYLWPILNILQHYRISVNLNFKHDEISFLGAHAVSSYLMHYYFPLTKSCSSNSYHLRNAMFFIDFLSIDYMLFLYAHIAPLCFNWLCIF